jgi:hypothetical protein
MAFKRLDPEDFIVSADSVSQTVWTGNVPNLTTFFTSSTQETDNSGNYYLSVFNAQQNVGSSNNSEIQFDIAFANKDGKGATAYNANVDITRTPTKTVYGQYRTLVLEDENSSFSFGDVTQDSFYVINVSRARYKEKLLPGSLNLTLSGSGGGNTALELTDNSKMVTLPTYYGTQRAYQIISGSDGTAYSGTGYTTNSGSYGLFLPDISTILLNSKALDLANAEGINLGTGYDDNTANENSQKLFAAIKGGASFRLNSEETITSDYVFIRARNSEFNYSENPSFISGSTGEIIYDYLINNPQSYVTTIGMYNDSNELVAVAKLSRPLRKDFTKEALVRVKLDF